MEVTSAQVVRFRAHALGLGTARGTPEQALATWAVKDSPPGAATTAVLARTAGALPVGWIDDRLADRSVVALYNARTATAILPAADAPAYATSLISRDDAGLRVIVAQSVPEQRSDYASAVDLAVEAIGTALDGRELSRDDLHAALRETLPAALLPWCEGCGSHHVRRGLLVMAGLHGRLCIVGKAGRQPRFARTDQWLGSWDPPEPQAAGAALVRRYLHGFGPSSPGELAKWAGLGNPKARSLWEPLADELAEVRVDGGPPRWVLAADVPALEDPPALRGIELLGPGDPLMQLSDREVLVPDRPIQKILWTALPTTGLLLDAGVPAATWKATKRGTVLEAVITPFDSARKPAQDAVEAAAERLAPHRSCKSASVSWAG